MQFAHYTVGLLLANPEAPDFDESDTARLLDAHLSHVADLHEAGDLLAVGPVSDPDGELVGLSILNVDVERARELLSADPAVQAGIFLLRVVPWMTPTGLVHFTPGRVPRSVAEARA